MAYMDCPNCNGEGYVECPHSSDDDTCLFCNGIGEVPEPEPDPMDAALEMWLNANCPNEQHMARYEQRQERRQARRDKRARLAFFTR